MRIPHLAEHSTYAHDNPHANAKTSTHNGAKGAQPAMKMPQYIAHQIVMAYSMQSAYPHGAIQAAAFGYMEPQYALYGCTLNYNSVQAQQVAPQNAVTNTGAPWGKPSAVSFTRSCYKITLFDGCNRSD